MKVISCDGLAAVCEDSTGLRETIDMSLVGPRQPGTWLLTFLGAAREEIDAESADQIARALGGLAAVMRGEGLGNAFADLENREPTLPPHLEAARKAGQTHG